MPSSVPPTVADNGSTPTPASPSAPSAPADLTPAGREATPAPPDAVDDEQSGEDKKDIIDMETFTQILELDEDDGEREFSRGMVWAYFSQAAETFKDMDVAYAAKDLPKLSSLGHFLKGSSAALGVAKVQASCENIQHYGGLRDEHSDPPRDLSRDEALTLIESTLERVKKEYEAAEKRLTNIYESTSGS